MQSVRFLKHNNPAPLCAARKIHLHFQIGIFSAFSNRR